MKLSSIVYALFCLAILAGFIASIRSGFSPFAQGGQRAFFRAAYGPTHK